MEDGEADIACTRGERTLLLNMILRAILDLRDPAERRDAMEWLTSEDSQDLEWSFRWCCSNLGISSGVTEKRIATIKKGDFFYKAAGRRRVW